MEITVRGRNIEVTEALKDYVGKRISKLDKYFDREYLATVTLVVEKDTHKVEVTIPLEGMILRGEEATGDMYSSIDMVVEKLEKQVDKYKAKLSKKMRTGFKVELVGVKEEDETPRIVKTKKFIYKPMPVEEAVMQMNLIGHSFFVFSNDETEEVNVVYKRKDGNIGLIEPEFL